MAEIMKVPQGSFALAREPVRADERLRAWDAADEYLLNHLAVTGVDVTGKVLLVNDSFGALGVALASDGGDLVSWSDSLSAHKGLAQNLASNGAAGAMALPSTENPSGKFDLVVIKTPKHNSLLEDQLHRLRPTLHEGSVVIAGGMAKHIHTSTLDLFAQIIGPTTTSLARKKARLAFIEFDQSLGVDPNPWPVTWSHDNIEVINRAGVFSTRKLDIGTRLLLECLPKWGGDGVAIDLGCGNGIVGAAFMAQNSAAFVTFVDESYGAVASAKATVEASFHNREAHFVLANRLGDVVERATVDLVLNNPPFHDSVALSTRAAVEMFGQSHNALRIGGELLVVGNRHLGYHVKLKRLFGNCETMASNSKFVVLRAVR